MATILVVDDDDMNLKMAEFILKKDMKENKVLLADSGMKAIDTLQREKSRSCPARFPDAGDERSENAGTDKETRGPEGCGRDFPDGGLGPGYGHQGGYDGRRRLHQEAVHAERLD